MTVTTLTLTNAKGETLQSTLTDEQASGILRSIPNGHRDHEFAMSLYRSYDNMIHRGWRFTPSQRYWMHLLAIRHSQPAEQPQAVCQLPEIVKFLEPASKSRKSGACVTFADLHPDTELSNNGTVRIKRASAHGKNAGCYWVSNGGDGQPTPDGSTTIGGPANELYAKIDAEGNLWPVKGKPIPTGVMAMLDEMEADPLSFVMRFGVRTGRCCFCNLPLTDDVSVKVGYGPVCAKSYNLPHGKKALQRLEQCQVGKSRLGPKAFNNSAAAVDNLHPGQTVTGGYPAAVMSAPAPEASNAVPKDETFSLLDAELDKIEQDLNALEARTRTEEPATPKRGRGRPAKGERKHFTVFASDLPATHRGFPNYMTHDGKEWVRGGSQRDREGELQSYKYHSGEYTLTVFND